MYGIVPVCKGRRSHLAAGTLVVACTCSMFGCCQGGTNTMTLLTISWPSSLAGHKLLTNMWTIRYWLRQDHVSPYTCLALLLVISLSFKPDNCATVLGLYWWVASVHCFCVIGHGHSIGDLTSSVRYYLDQLNQNTHDTQCTVLDKTVLHSCDSCTTTSNGLLATMIPWE